MAKRLFEVTNLLLLILLLDSTPVFAIADTNSTPTTLLSLMIEYKLQVVIFLFLIVILITLLLWLLDRAFRARIAHKLSTNTQTTDVDADQALLNKIVIARITFVIGLACLFFFMLFTYQYYSNQNLVMSFATGIFLLNVVGTYYFGSLKRTRQTETLVNKLHSHIMSKEDAQIKLLSSERRLQQQNASLASLAAMQLNRETLPKVFFRQLIRQSAETLNVARVSVWMYSTDKQTLECEALYDLTTQGFSHGHVLTAKDFPNYFEALTKERVIAAEDAYTHPMTKDFTNDYLPANQIASMLDATIWQDDEILGVLCHEHIGQIRAWALDEQSYVGSLADLIRLTIEASARRKAEEELLKHSQR